MSETTFDNDEAFTSWSPVLTAWTGFLLGNATKQLQMRNFAVLEKLGIRPPHNAVLNLLAAGPCSQVALSEQVRCDRTTMVSLIDDLEKIGLVVRQRNVRDRRVHDVTLTEEGKLARMQANRLLSEADSAFFAPLSTEEYKLFRQMLFRLLNVTDASAVAGSSEESE